MASQLSIWQYIIPLARMKCNDWNIKGVTSDWPNKTSWSTFVRNQMKYLSKCKGPVCFGSQSPYITIIDQLVWKQYGQQEAVSVDGENHTCMTIMAICRNNGRHKRTKSTWSTDWNFLEDSSAWRTKRRDELDELVLKHTTTTHDIAVFTVVYVHHFAVSFILNS